MWSAGGLVESRKEFPTSKTSSRKLTFKNFKREITLYISPSPSSRQQNNIFEKLSIVFLCFLHWFRIFFLCVFPTCYTKQLTAIFFLDSLDFFYQSLLKIIHKFCQGQYMSLR